MSCARLASSLLSFVALVAAAVACSDEPTRAPSEPVCDGGATHDDGAILSDAGTDGTPDAAADVAADVPAAVPLTCTTSCDDGNLCTTDSCVVGLCQHVTVTCGSGEVCAPSLLADKDLIGYWPLDGCDGHDAGPNSLNGVVVGKPQCVDGPIGKALEFDGATTWVQVPNDLAMDVTRTGISYGGWFRSQDSADYTVALSKEGLFVLGRTTGQIGSAMANGPKFDWFWKFLGDWKDQAWHHFAVVYDGTQVTHYIDGAVAGTYPLSGPIAHHWNASWGCDLAIGARGLNCGTPGLFWHGGADEVWWFGRVLTALEVKRLAGKAANAWSGGCGMQP